MSKMSWIAHLCEAGDRKALIEELYTTDLTALTSKTVEEVADGFIKAHNTIKKRKNEDAYSKLNEIQNEIIKYTFSKKQKEGNEK